MDADEYCRELEAYLCRRNEGHLVRIVGPAFDKVREWAHLGIPLRIAFHGIDRYVDRAAAKGPRRRPARIEFCEADVLDAFDEWRRVVGVRAARDNDAEAPARHRRSLPAHLDRAMAMLTALRAGAVLEADWDAALDRAVGELDRVRAGADRLRGAAREAALAELTAIDGRLLDAARAAAGPTVLTDTLAQAEAELGPFRQRLDEAALTRALRAAQDRVLRDRLGLPVIVFD